MYTAIHDMKLWHMVNNNLNDIKVLDNITLHPQIDMYGHSGNSIMFCYKHMQYLKNNGWESYVNIMKSS
jgi:hypothetical protein